MECDPAPSEPTVISTELLPEFAFPGRLPTPITVVPSNRVTGPPGKPLNAPTAPTVKVTLDPTVPGFGLELTETIVAAGLVTRLRAADMLPEKLASPL